MALSSKDYDLLRVGPAALKTGWSASPVVMLNYNS
jgi:hypothetical protein